MVLYVTHQQWRVQDEARKKKKDEEEEEDEKVAGQEMRQE